jgi:hypothetical protein
MQPIIDADTHISESEEMWAMFDKEMYGRRPVLLSLPDDTLYGNWNKTWLIDGNIFPKPAGKGGFRLITPSASKIQSNRKDLSVACRDMTDVPSRLADMDRLGIAGQPQQPRFLARREHNLDCRKRVGQSFARSFEVGFLAGPALEKGIDPPGTRKRGQVALLVRREEMRRDLPDVGVVADLFDIDPKRAAIGHRN